MIFVSTLGFSYTPQKILDIQLKWAIGADVLGGHEILCLNYIDINRYAVVSL